MKEVLIPGTKTCYGPDFVAHVVPNHEDDEHMYRGTRFGLATKTLEEVRELRDTFEDGLKFHCDTPEMMRSLRVGYAIFNAEIAKRTLRSGDPT